MKLSDLIALIGDDNINVQNVEQSAVKMKTNKKHGDLEITFASAYDIMNGANKVGLVVWFDKDDFDEALKCKQ